MAEQEQAARIVESLRQYVKSVPTSSPVVKIETPDCGGRFQVSESTVWDHGGRWASTKSTNYCS
jgi:hypothetical protein